MAVVKYGINFPQGYSPNQLECELAAFKFKHGPEQGGLGTYTHCRNAMKALWPKYQHHSWSKMRFEGLCAHSVNSWVGCAAAGKTWDAGAYGMTFFIADPLNTAVILTSTTGKMVRKRIWPVIQELYHTCPGFPGNLVDSKTTLQAQKGDDKHGIFALAVREGNTSKAVADIQGLHCKRILLIVDEATDTPEAVFEAVANLSKGCSDFQILCIGNPVSTLDPHGLMCTPKDGWKSVSADDEEWETAGVDKWGIPPGLCVHFDGLKSPNIKAGKDLFPFLITRADVDKSRKVEYGEESLGFWKYTRGFWPPETVSNRIFSEALVTKHDGMGKHIFISKKTKIAGLDAGFGGDKCVLRFAEIGDLADGSLGIQLGKSVNIPINVKSKEPIHYQLKERIIKECDLEGVKPEHFGMDVTTEGGGLADILSMEWSGGSRIVRVEFGGAPSDKPVSTEDPRSSKDVYDRKVTELYFMVRRFLQSGQLKGLQTKEIIQFCSREYEQKAKIKLDTKEECKKKIGHSPDDADAVVIVVEVARRMGAIPGASRENKPDEKWVCVAKEQADIFQEDGITEVDMPAGNIYALDEI